MAPSSVRMHALSNQPRASIGCTLNLTKGTSVEVHALGLYVVAGNMNPEIVKIVATGTGATVASAVVDTALPADKYGFVVATLIAPVTLHGDGTAQYVLLVGEDGCDAWLDDTSTVLTTTPAAAGTSVYGSYPTWQPGAGGLNHCYGPLNFYYTPEDL